MRSIFSLFILSVVLLGCSNTPSPEPISQVNGGTQVVLQSEINNHEVIQEFDIDNCDGKADATRIERRSSSVDVTVSTELAARIGASAQVISADVQAAVGTELSIGGERETSIELKAPPNTHMFFQLAWVGKSRIGVVQNVSGSNIPVAFQSFSPDNVRIKSQYDIGCRNTPTPPTQIENTTTPQTQIENTPTSDQYFGWVICWHGRDGHEYLIAYPERDVKQGIDLKFNLINAQGRQVEVANDSLKMCYINGEWHGYPDPNPWFPTVSYIKFLDREFLVCSDSPGCQGSQWTMLPEKYFPSNAPELQAPKEEGIHIIVYE